MAEQQMDMDSPQQRKRIAVACGRCRKRKIRCSGDMGGGQPCQNCKNAGHEQCLFLRVASREAPFLNEPSEFTYSVPDARGLASRAPVVSTLPYTQELPSLPPSDVLTSPYRTSAAYPYVPAPSKQYYPAVSSYSPQYSDEFDYNLGVSQSVLSSDVSMMPSQWGSRTKTSYGGAAMYNMDSSYYGGAAGLVHRPAPPVASEPSSLSLSGFGADLPPTSRLLPDPAGRTSSLPYPGGVVKTPASGQTHSQATLADVAAAATYVSSFDTSGMSYTSPAASLSGAGQQQHHRASPDAYGPSSSGDSLFGEQERSLQSQGSAYDMTTYTSDPRRDSLSGHGGNGSGGGGGGSTLSNGQTYVPSEPMHTPHPHPHPHSHHHTHVLAYPNAHHHAPPHGSPVMGGGGGADRVQNPTHGQPEPESPGQTHAQQTPDHHTGSGSHGGAAGLAAGSVSAVGGGGSTLHADTRIAVTTRR
ncbi:hypothetical protein QBC47DRAFT_359191 [Echria macrotheca]|uniref:Zn(2)-C6 fungal-type domain-containing protein n=1 Tax=Echria macrotheca TaxID=438768 RepID=A0AAJ0BF19_9PEZI|nr:hypothetical protein QBC47DRAFT_359191 [Echria macrotheca]